MLDFDSLVAQLVERFLDGETVSRQTVNLFFQVRILVEELSYTLLKETKLHCRNTS